MANDNKKNRLSTKGLASIFGDGLNDLITNIEKTPAVAHNFAQLVEVAKIVPNPYQPRINFDEAEISELSASIKNYGLVQPIVVKKTLTAGVFQLIAGERRTKAAKLAGLATIPAVIIEASDEQMMELAIIENIQRVDLNPIEEAQAYQTLISKMKWTQETLAQKVNKSRSHITNTLRLLNLPMEVLQMLQRNELTMGHVKPLLSLGNDITTIIAIAKRAYLEQWSVRKVEDIIKSRHLQGKKKPLSATTDIHLAALENSLTQVLATKVRINNKQVVINYHDNDDLNRILTFLKLI